MKKLYLFITTALSFMLVTSCTGESKTELQSETQEIKTSELGGNDYNSDSEYKYEYRTGATVNYEYNYDVMGEDEDGNEISGNVDMNGRYGNGYVTDDNGDEKEVEVEWVDYGKMEATDEDGNTYEMEAE